MSPKKYLKKVVFAEPLDISRALTFLPSRKKEELLKLVSFLRGKRVVHINATERGGGVAELLKSLISYFRSLGLQSDWYYIGSSAGKNFFEITNKIHNALQGSDIKISASEWREYKEINRRVTEELENIDCDVLVVNDPQLLFSGFYSNIDCCKIFFCHIDTSSVSRDILEKLVPAIHFYDKIVFSNKEFVYDGAPLDKIRIFTPAIDPLSAKQEIFGKKRARMYLKKYGGVPKDGPLIAQISRFDIWKNPLGVVEAFRIVQNTYPKARLALVGFNEASDNPAAANVYKDIMAVAGKTDNVFTFFNSKNIDVLKFTVMAQNGAHVIVQNSFKEGFGLTVTEAMWKKQAVVGGVASGIRKQITNGKNGFIAKNSQELAEKILFLLKHPGKAKEIGENAKKTVIEKFLFPRLIADHLKLYKSCLK